MDRFELALLAAFAAVSVWVLALDLWQVIAHGRIWTGTDGFFLVDQMQYVAWIREASQHLLASNLFVLRSTPADYFQPAVAVSGAFVALGVAPWLALLLWKPVAVVGMFLAARAYVHRTVAPRGHRRAALTLALFFGSFSVVYGTFSVVGDLFPGFLSWGYPFGLLAVAAMIAALVSYDTTRRSGRWRWAAPALGALASSLHPWQGELLVLIVVGAEAVRWRSLPRSWARLKLPIATIIATSIPLFYYLLLGRMDTSWGLAREASKHSFSFWSIALALAPLAVPAVFGYRGRPRSFLAAATHVWPLAALVIYGLSATELSATPLHAFDGITLPLAVLAVAGVQRAPLRRIPAARLVGWTAVAAATIPATFYELRIANQFMAPTPGNANFITAGERSALHYLNRDRTAGGVLTRFYLGAIVPAQTGRRTFVGNCLWSQPLCSPRAQTAQKLFDGSLSTRDARTFVRQSGARFVLADCSTTTDLTRTLSPLLISIRRFGCATVYELDAPGPPTGLLARGASRRL